MWRRQRWERCSHKPRYTRSHQKLKEEETLFLRDSGNALPYFSWDFWPPDVWQNAFLLFCTTQFVTAATGNNKMIIWEISQKLSIDCFRLIYCNHSVPWTEKAYLENYCLETFMGPKQNTKGWRDQGQDGKWVTT
jgi:hypothetical protein